MQSETLTQINCNNIQLRPSDYTSTVSICYSVYADNTYIASVSVSVNDTSHLKEIFIEKAYRRKGIGTYLLNLLKITSLNCTSWNERGIAFYNAIGFTEAKRDIYLITFKKE